MNQLLFQERRLRTKCYGKKVVKNEFGDVVPDRKQKKIAKTK